MRYDSIAFRCLRHFANNPGLHKAVTIIQLAQAIDVKAGMHVYQRVRCDLMPVWPGLKKTDDNTYWMTSRDAKKAQRVVKRVAQEYVRRVTRDLRNQQAKKAAA